MQTPVDIRDEFQTQRVFKESRALLQLVSDLARGDADAADDSCPSQLSALLERLHNDLIYLCVKSELESQDRFINVREN